ncbi:MAG: glycosyltransferase family 39 protein, partial [Lautropia sp.]|nr:glycosyltransferase family 39 protein [Lautropia sp.]
MWIDEAFSLYHARHSLADLWGMGWELESSPPLFYSAIWAWTRLFGEAEPVARALSLLFTALAALCLYSAAGTLGGRRAGAVAAILFLCQPLMFQYSLEVRPYALLCFLVAAALAAFSKALADLEQNNLGSMVSVARRVAPIIAAGALATYTHATAPAVLAAMFTAAAAYGVLRRSDGRFWVVWLLSGCVVLLAIAPQLRVMFGVLATNERGIAWISTPGLRWFYGVLRSLAVGEHSWGEIATKLVGSSVICVIAWSIGRLRDRPLIMVVGLILPAAGFAVLWGVSWWQPVLMPRTSLWLVAPLCVLVGCGISTVQWQGARFWMPVALLVLSFAVMSVKNMKNRTEDRP